MVPDIGVRSRPVSRDEKDDKRWASQASGSWVSIAFRNSSSNVSKIEQPFGEIRTPEPLDVAWISENYHDFKNMGMFSTDTNAMDRAVFADLKPGGTYFITDYVAAAGSGTRDTQSLHRIDPEVIKREVTAAGFMLEAESNALMNPSDNLAERSRDRAPRN